MKIRPGHRFIVAHEGREYRVVYSKHFMARHDGRGKHPGPVVA